MSVPVKGSLTQQGRTSVLVGTVKLQDLIEHYKIDWHDPEANPEGYQRRMTSYRRAEDFADFVLRGGVCPTALFLNVRAAQLPEASDGEVEFPDDVVFWVVDGQHRLAGLQRAADEDPRMLNVQVPVAVANLPTVEEEAAQFLTINKTQRGVDVGLAEVIVKTAVEREGPEAIAQGGQRIVLPKSLAKEAVWEARAVQVAEVLTGDEDSPLFGLIRIGEGVRGTVIRLKSFVRAIMPVVREAAASTVLPSQPEDLGRTYVRLWGAVRSLVPEPFHELAEKGRPREWVLLKSTGLYVVTRLLARIAHLCWKDEQAYFTQERFEEILSVDKMHFTDEFWRSQGENTAASFGTSEKSFAAIVDLIAREIEDHADGLQGEDQKARYVFD